MKFQVEFESFQEDDDKLEIIGCKKEIHEEYIAYTKELQDFSDLKLFQKVVENYFGRDYELILDMDNETPIIYLYKSVAYYGTKMPRM